MKYLILHKSQWERLKRQYESHKVPPKDSDYVQRLHELSQKWIRSWPVQGHVELFNKTEATKNADVKSEIKKFALRKEKDTSKAAILKARQLIFEDSCYGRQLISCLIESKMLEERDAQIKFQNELKQNKASRKQEMLSKEEEIYTKNSEEKTLQQRKKKENEIGIINKTMFDMQKRQRAHERDAQKQKEIEDMRLIKLLLENEKNSKETCGSSKSVREQNIEYDKLRQEMEPRHQKEQEKDERINRVWQKYGERVRCGQQLTYEKIKRETHGSLMKQKVYNILEEMKTEETNKYNAFVEKGIRDLDERILLREKKKEDMKKQQEIEEIPLAEIKEFGPDENSRKLNSFRSCDRQTLFCASSKRDKRNILGNEKGKKCSGFLLPSKSLVEKFKIREKEPSPWNGTKTDHEEFVMQANKIVQECRHKQMARKVVDEYKRVNCLYDNSLPISY